MTAPDDEEVAQADKKRESIPMVRRALEIIKPAATARSHCGYAIETSCGYDETSGDGLELLGLHYRSRAGSGKTKQTARSAVAALKKADTLIRKLGIPVPIEGKLKWAGGGWARGEGFPFHEVRKWRDAIEKIANTPTHNVVRMGVERKRIAVGDAYRLLLEFSSAKITATEDGKFCLLAAVLFGDEDANLSSQCRAYLRKVKQLSKK